MSKPDDEVGYKKPPTYSQFKKGQSGNPKGRTKGHRDLKTDLQEELSELIVIRENGQERRISKFRGLLKALVAAALRGDVRAANTVVSFYTKSLAGVENASAASDAPAEDQDIIDAYLDRELQRRSKEHVSASPKRRK